jgi:hypothetical protein
MSFSTKRAYDSILGSVELSAGWRDTTGGRRLLAALAASPAVAGHRYLYLTAIDVGHGSPTDRLPARRLLTRTAPGWSCCPREP